MGLIFFDCITLIPYVVFVYHVIFILGFFLGLKSMCFIYLFISDYILIVEYLEIQKIMGENRLTHNSTNYS